LLVFEDGPLKKLFSLFCLAESLSLFVGFSDSLRDKCWKPTECPRYAGAGRRYDAESPCSSPQRIREPGSFGRSVGLRAKFARLGDRVASF
jgi:hypothetical protein